MRMAQFTEPVADKNVSCEKFGKVIQLSSTILDLRFPDRDHDFLDQNLDFLDHPKHG